MIEEIRKIGKGDRYYLILDDGKKFVIEAEILAKYKLKTGDELDDEKLYEILLANGDFAAFDRALSYLEKNIKTEKGIRDYLKQKGFLPESIDNAVDKLREYGYIDDAVFTDCYIRTYQNSKGKKLLRFELLQKGVSSEIVDEKISNIEYEDEFEVCKKMFEKYIKNKNYDLKLKQKAFAHLASKGFSSDIISKVINNFEK